MTSSTAARPAPPERVNIYQPPDKHDFAYLDLNYQEFLPEDRQARILDLGCGYGRILAWLKRRGYTNVVGLDREPEIIDWVRQHITPSVEVCQDPGEYLDRHQGSFALIIAKDMIYYFPKNETVVQLRLIHEALRPDGCLLAEVFNGAALTGPYLAWKDVLMEWIPTEISVRLFLEKAGYGSVRMVEPRPVPGGWKRALFHLAGRLWRRILRLIYLLERGRDEHNPQILTTRFLAVARAGDSKPK